MGWSVKKIVECINNNRLFGDGDYIYIRQAHKPYMKGKWQAIQKGVRENVLTVEPCGSDCFIVKKVEKSDDCIEN